MTTDTLSTWLAWYLAALGYATWRAVRWVALELTGGHPKRRRRRSHVDVMLSHRNREV